MVLPPHWSPSGWRAAAPCFWIWCPLLYTVHSSAGHTASWWAPLHLPHTFTRVQSASGRTQQQREPVSDFTHDVSHPTSARLCLRGRLSFAWVWWRRCARTDGWSCARRGGISPSSRCMRAAVGQTPAPLSLEQTIASPSARSRLRTWLKARFWTANYQLNKFM